MATVTDFNKPANQLVVDLINASLGSVLAVEQIAAITINETVIDEIPYSTIPDQESYLTRATLSMVNPVAITDVRFQYPEVRIKYHRLSIATFLYKDLINESTLTVPGVLYDRYPTTIETAVADALAYLQSEYSIQLTPQDCLIESHPELVRADGSWPVSVALRLDHPVWVGTVQLDAYVP